MKRSSKRAFGGLLAGVMMFSTVISTTTIASTADEEAVVAYANEAVVSDSAVDVGTDTGTDTETSDDTAGDIVLATPEEGQTYSADFTTVEVNAKVNGTTYGQDTIAVVSPKDEAYGHDTQHGLAVYDGDQIQVAVAGKADITLLLCKYGNGTEYTVTDEAGNNLGTVAAKGETDGTTAVFNYDGDATTLTFTLAATGESYIHGITVANADTSALATPESGKTYSADFKTLTDAGLVANDKVGGMLFGDDTIKIVSPTDYAYFHDGSHGLALKSGDQIQVAVAGDATIVVSACRYGYGDVYTVTNEAGETLGTISAIGVADGDEFEFDYKGDATTLTLTGSLTNDSGEIYLHSVTVKNASLPVGEAENFELWLDDIATDVASGTDDTGATTYTKTVEPGTISYKDSTIELVGNASEKFTPSISAAKDYDFGVRVANAYKAGSRNANPNDIATIPQQGDGTAIVFTPAATGTFNTYLYTTSFLRVWDFDAKSGERYGYTDSDSGVPSYAFKAEAGHTYVLSTTGKTNNCAFAGFEYIIDEPITVKITGRTDDGKYKYSNVTITLTDVALGTTYTIKPDTTEIELAKNHTYSISTDDGGAAAAINGEETFKAVEDSSISIYFTEIPDVTLTGEITGVDDLSAVKSIKFVSMNSGVEYPATINADGTYTATLKPGDYNTVAEADGYETIDHASVSSEGENVNEIYFESTEHDYTYIDMPADLGSENPVLTYNNNSGKMKVNNSTSIAAQAGDTIVVPVEGKKVVTVAGWYSGTWDINGKNSVTTSSSANATSPTTTKYFTDGTETSVTVNLTEEGKTNYLYWVKIEDVVPFQSEITVPGDADTLNDAMNLIYRMNRPEGEDGRVTINLAADFQEQVVIDSPYITINGNGHEINWYYGVGYKYYSMSSNGLYSEALYHDKYDAKETPGQMWGGVVIVRGDYFHAEDVTFRNTFNYELTEKEKGDGLIPVNMPDRFTTDVATYACKERSNALLVEADFAECYNTKILSSQDTLGRNSNATTLTYFKDCVIGGNVDYICGAGGMLFDNCELQWKSYSDDKNNTKIGYITAARQNADRPYIFRNCTITKDSDLTVLGMYGRTWQDHSTVYFVNCETNGLINTDAWGEMGSGQYATASFNEYNNTSNGEPFASNPEATYAASQVTDETVIGNLTSDDVITAYLAGWKPYYYDAAEESYDWGDVDHDGTVSANDASLTLQYALNPDIFSNVVSAYDVLDDVDTTVLFDKSLADVAYSDIAGAITAFDAACILEKSLNDDYLFEVERDGKDPEWGTTESTTEATTEVTTETSTETTTEAPSGDAVTVYVVGDSTACHYADTEDTNYWYKRVGFGDKLGDFLTSNAKVVNLALSGRSSKSFATGINENGITDDSAVANYAQLKSDIKAGDYLIIAWGHNDEKADKYRYTSVSGGINDEGSFKNSLYTNYIKVAQDAGATPILVTPIIRANTTTLSANDIHQPTGTTAYPGGDYSQCIRDLGAELGITVIDQTANTQKLFEELTPSTGNKAPTFTLASDGKTLESKTDPEGYYTLHAALQDGSVDTTHLNAFGATYVANMLANDIMNSDNSLANYVNHDTVGAWDRTFNHDACFNTDWVPFDESVYIPSSIWKVSSPWAGSAFGSGLGVITEDSHPNHDITEVGTNAVELYAANNKGKIASGEDGLVMYFQEIGANEDFTLTATAHINSYDATTNQSGFGLMLRDNMITDYAYKTKAPYFAVGNTAQASGAEMVQVFHRGTDGKLAKDVVSATTAAADSFAEGTEVKLMISRKNGVVTAQFGDDAVYTYDTSLTDLTKVKADTDYVGIFVSRAADVTFNNITLTK
jgi:pectin methylesterase-like acyl-CoA thioesterase/lysophospholipase L1-like esterase